MKFGGNIVHNSIYLLIILRSFKFDRFFLKGHFYKNGKEWYI
jgi:hypothetical protein